jgi:secondary thiamine-phosphate synthase enzyme
MWIQKEVTIPAKRRGFHLITDELTQQLPELQNINIGLLHLFIKHTSASLTINENADPTVRSDMEKHFYGMGCENFEWRDSRICNKWNKASGRV